MVGARKKAERSSDERLFDAIRSGDVSVFVAAMADGANPNATSRQGAESALMAAVEHDQVEILRLLLQQGADVNYATVTGWTALHHAVDLEVDSCNQGGPPPDLRLVRPLLEAGARVDVAWHSDRGPRTPIEMARGYRWQQGVDAMQAAVGAS